MNLGIIRNRSIMVDISGIKRVRSYAQVSEIDQCSYNFNHDNSDTCLLLTDNRINTLYDMLMGYQLGEGREGAVFGCFRDVGENRYVLEGLIDGTPEITTGVVIRNVGLTHALRENQSFLEENGLGIRGIFHSHQAGCFESSLDLETAARYKRFFKYRFLFAILTPDKQIKFFGHKGAPDVSYELIGEFKQDKLNRHRYSF